MTDIPLPWESSVSTNKAIKRHNFFLLGGSYLVRYFEVLGYFIYIHTSISSYFTSYFAPQSSGMPDYKDSKNLVPPNYC